MQKCKCLKIFSFMIILSLVCSTFLGNSTISKSIFGVQSVKAASMDGYENLLFNNKSVHKIDIEMENWDSFIETCSNEEFSSCNITIDGEKYNETGIRAKGNTSLSSVKMMKSNRYSFKVKFDKYTKDQSYHGLDRLCLNNLIQDNTMMKDYLAYQLMREFGVASPLCSFAYLTVNGKDYGLYLAVEDISDSFLTRNYGSKPGALYKPDSTKGFGEFDPSKVENFDLGKIGKFDFSKDGNFDWGNMGEFDPNKAGNFDWGNMGEFDPSKVGNFDPGKMWSMGSEDVKLKYIDDNIESYPSIFDNAKNDVSKKDKKRLIESLKNLSEYKNLEETVDIDKVINYFVVHNFVSNGDSYTGMIIHNYYLYEKKGIMSMIPWDYNLAYGTFQVYDVSGAINASIDNPIPNKDLNDRPMFGWIFSDEKYINQYHDTFTKFISEWIDSGKLVKMIDRTSKLIRPYVKKDPTKFCTLEDFDKGVTAIKQFVTLRGEAVKNQLNGDTTLVDTSNIKLTDMGSMGGFGGFGGFGGKDGKPNEPKPDAPSKIDDNNGQNINTDVTIPNTDICNVGSRIKEIVDTFFNSVKEKINTTINSVKEKINAKNK